MPLSVPFIDLKRFEPGFEDAVLGSFSSLTQNAQFVGGSEVARLEKRLSEQVGVEHTVSCANGTDAIQLALRAIGVERGDIVLVPNVTFWATFEAVVNVGGTPVTVDCDISDGGVSFDAFEQAIKSSRPKAAILAHLYGWGSARLRELRDLCDQNDVSLVEDGAQCFGAEFEDASIYAGASIATTSFYPAKVLGAAGDGGAVFTNDPQLAERTRQLTNHGRTAHYGHGLVGWNSRMDALQAAYLNHALDHIDARISSRRAAAGVYENALSKLDPGCGLEVMSAPKSYSQNGYCNVCLVRDPSVKNRLEAALKGAGIGFGNIYPSVMSEQPAAAQYLKEHVGGRMGQDLCTSVLNLPLFPYITRAELDRVLDVVKEALDI
ncbi:DegT/DnrJ/EryC1/StrS family aminotransferase [Algirhabdus cladophorae]|uniref:DegT/DnrJ/EryC1/StrS family aminotransferase n=1 Tax=Algirhabdus cladophorae TaxID=3377108 RepID=UPI003B84ABBF